MLVCVSCGKLIANTDPTCIRYGGCSACSLENIKKGMEIVKGKEQERTNKVFQVIREVNDAKKPLRCNKTCVKSL